MASEILKYRRIENRKSKLNLSAWRSVKTRHKDCAIPFCTDVKITLLGAWLSLIDALVNDISVTPSHNRSDPIFIVGHWRSGTTLLHELLGSTSSVVAPSTYACMNPQFFWHTERAMIRLFGTRSIERPMDQMRISLASPQEDGFALLALGAVSPYECILFPKAFLRSMALSDPEKLSIPDRNRWDRTFVRFLALCQENHPHKRLLLKSPPHSFRIRHLARLYPNAASIRIVRHPEWVFQSPCHLWQNMWRTYAIGPVPSIDELEFWIIETMKSLGQNMEEALRTLAPNRWFSICPFVTRTSWIPLTES